MKKENKVLLFGEVLFDDFGKDKVVLGGAPFNVAWHLQGFGLKPFFVSRVGNDENGNRIIKKMKDWGMSTLGLQIDDKYPTGIVSVTTKNGEPKFDIRPERAYDFINYAELKKSISNNSFSIVYNGTLALRNEPSYNALRTLKSNSQVKTFLDVNLRKPWWTRKTLLKEMKQADWVKCNAEELKSIADVFNIENDDFIKLAKNICTILNLNFLIVTLGEEGASIIDKEQRVISSDPEPVLNLIDTVGAGDAFSAVSIFGILEKWNSQTILKRAIEFSAKICQVKGATLNDKDYYELLLKKWKK